MKKEQKKSDQVIEKGFSVSLDAEAVKLLNEAELFMLKKGIRVSRSAVVRTLVKTMQLNEKFAVNAKNEYEKWGRPKKTAVTK